MTLKLDWDAIDKVIYEQLRGPVDDLAQQIASRVDVGSVTKAQVKVTSGKTTKWGWPVAMITIAHPAAQAMEAKHGTLKRAAASVGLTVKAKK